jgi:hypothetical protein
LDAALAADVDVVALVDVLVDVDVDVGDAIDDTLG